jgi:hypothetical protein
MQACEFTQLLKEARIEFITENITTPTADSVLRNTGTPSGKVINSLKSSENASFQGEQVRNSID